MIFVWVTTPGSGTAPCWAVNPPSFSDLLHAGRPFLWQTCRTVDEWYN